MEQKQRAVIVGCNLKNDKEFLNMMNELSPSQIRNLHTDLKCKVIDRTVLILDILDKRAKSKEAQRR